MYCLLQVGRRVCQWSGWLTFRVSITLMRQIDVAQFGSTSDCGSAAKCMCIILHVTYILLVHLFYWQVTKTAAINDVVDQKIGSYIRLVKNICDKCT